MFRVVLAGTYASGTALTSANTAKVNVDVTSVGTYTITASKVNGISFTGTGTFTTTGIQPVTLIGSGTPTSAGSFNYIATGSASVCTFSVTATGTVVTTGVLTCTIGGVAKTFNVGASAVSITPSSLQMQGAASASSTENISLTLVKSSGAIGAGTYDQNGGASYVVAATYIDASSKSYLATNSLNSINIVITSITATEVKGTFTGTLKDNNGAGPNVATITNGVFDLFF